MIHHNTYSYQVTSICDHHHHHHFILPKTRIQHFTTQLKYNWRVARKHKVHEAGAHVIHNTKLILPYKWFLLAELAEIFI